MVECPECGARNADNSTFCVRCGAALLVAAATQDRAPGEDTAELAPVVQEPEALLAEAADLLGEDDPAGAAARCREALELAPDMVAAYSLLGMAEEKRGDLAAAADAYRRVLEIDPGRIAEREKLKLISEQLGVAAPPPLSEPEPTAGSAEGSWLTRYGLYVAAAAGAFCVLMILTAIMVRAQMRHRAERTYAEQMQIGKQSLDSRDYQAAVAAFEVALKARPGDRDAQQALRYAQRKAAQAQSPRMTARGQPRAHMAQIVPSTGPNIFPPVPIGPSKTQQPQTPRARTAVKPPVVNWGHDNSASSSSNGSSTVLEEEFPSGPLEDHEAQQEDTGAPPPTEEEPTPSPPERSRGEISIWVSEEPGPAQTGGTPAPTTSENTEPDDAARAESLRRQANALREQGRGEQAADLYSQAIEAYQADSRANPRAKSVNDAAIQACEQARNLCRPSQE